MLDYPWPKVWVPGLIAVGRSDVRSVDRFGGRQRRQTGGGRSSEGLLPQLVQHLRQNRTVLREKWARRIAEAELLTAMTPDELFSEATAVYDNYVEVLETGSVEALQAYPRDLPERIIPRDVETNEVVGIALLLRDVLARSLFEKYQSDFDMLNQMLDAYEPAANRIATRTSEHSGSAP